jgi:5'-3' exonuclease
VTPRRLYLIDASIYIFRGWQGLPGNTRNRFGEPDNAVQGFTETLCHIIENHRPPMMLCAFDESSRKGTRNRIYPPYKADRPPAPEDLVPQFARCRQVAEALGLASLGSDQVEADDIIGHFSALAQDLDLPVTIVTGDKDLAQFVREHDHYWDFGRRELAGYEDLRRRFRVRPEQIADWLALCGDKSDNIPGVPGVGPSIAARLLIRWNDLQTVMANLEAVSMMRFRGAPRVSQLLYEHRSEIELARSLTGLVVDTRLPQDLAGCHRQPLEEVVLSESLRDAGFHDDLALRVARRLASK